MSQTNKKNKETTHQIKVSDKFMNYLNELEEKKRTKKTKTCFYINAEEQTIIEMEVPNNGTLKFMYPLIGDNTVYIQSLPIVKPDEINYQLHAMFVCEDGRRNYPDTNFHYKGYKYPVCGNAFIVNHNEDGDMIDCTITIEELTERILFI